MVDHEALAAHLTRLQLTAIRDQLDSLLDEAAEKGMTLRETVAFLVEREVARGDERRIEMAFKIAHFPAVRELADFDFKAQPSVDERLAFYAKPKLLIVDELGYLPFEPCAAHLRACASRPTRRQFSSPWPGLLALGCFSENTKSTGARLGSPTLRTRRSSPTR